MKCNLNSPTGRLLFTYSLMWIKSKLGRTKRSAIRPWRTQSSTSLHVHVKTIWACAFEPLSFTTKTWPLKSISVCARVVFRLRLLCEIRTCVSISAPTKWIYVNVEHTINMKLSKNQMMKTHKHTLAWSHYVHAVQGRYSLRICILLYSFSRRSSCNEIVLLRITCNVCSLLTRRFHV